MLLQRPMLTAAIRAMAAGRTMAMSTAVGGGSGLTTLNAWKAHGGTWTRYSHESTATNTPMTFSVFTPPGATDSAPAPCIFYLSGLTCTDENFVQKAGASQAAAAHGVALIAPDTSPRNAEPVAGENDSYDFGSAAGFYIDATEQPWCDAGYAMETYVTEELPALAAQIDGIDTGVASIMGHSMGGHGALSLGFKSLVNGGPVRFRSISAFSPICHPTNGAWGQKAFEGYLGSVEAGEPHDATLIMKGASGAAADALRDVPLLVHTGGADNFYHDGQLQPEALQEAMEAVGRQDTNMVKLEEGYDHSYFFISTFIDEHVEFHAKHLLAK